MEALQKEDGVPQIPVSCRYEPDDEEVLEYLHRIFA